MDKVYKRINWNTNTCNGSMDPNKYLYSQIARAICEAAYEKPLTIEDISLKTGLPAMYIEDELPRLIGGDAIVKNGGKYATNFIVLRLCDKKVMETRFAPLVSDIADYFAKLFKEQESQITKMNFHGSGFTMKRLGYIALSAVLRKKVKEVKSGLNLQDGPFPPRLDGGYGWYVVDEKETENEQLGTTESGCNIAGEENDYIYYFWIGKYLRNNIYDGTRWIYAHGIMGQTKNGIIPDNALTNDERVRLLENNLITKNSDYQLNFPVFGREQYDSFISLFDIADTRLDELLKNLITDIHKCFQAFVPKRLDKQINQWVSYYVHNIIGFVAEELIKRGALEKPDEDKPLTNGVFCILGAYEDV